MFTARSCLSFLILERFLCSNFTTHSKSVKLIAQGNEHVNNLGWLTCKSWECMMSLLQTVPSYRCRNPSSRCWSSVQVWLSVSKDYPLHRIQFPPSLCYLWRWENHLPLRSPSCQNDSLAVWWKQLEINHFKSWTKSPNTELTGTVFKATTHFLYWL